jgi:hypothetical protein
LFSWFSLTNRSFSIRVVVGQTSFLNNQEQESAWARQQAMQARVKEIMDKEKEVCERRNAHLCSEDTCRRMDLAGVRNVAIVLV